MNKWTYPRQPLTWGNLLKIIERMPPEQREREVVGYGYFLARNPVDDGYRFVPLRKFLVTDEADASICDPGQPVLLF